MQSQTSLLTSCRLSLLLSVKLEAFYSENICKNSAMYLSQSKDNHINSKITNSQSECISPLNLQTVTRTRRQAQLFLRLCDRGSSEWTEGLASTGNSCRSRAPSQKRELGWTRHPTVHEKSFTHKWPSLRHSAGGWVGQKFCRRAPANQHANKAHVRTGTCQNSCPNTKALRQNFQT